MSNNVIKTQSKWLIQKLTNIIQNYVKNPKDQEVFLENNNENYIIISDTTDANNESLSKNNYKEDQLELKPKHEFSTKHYINIFDEEDKQEVIKILIFIII